MNENIMRLTETRSMDFKDAMVTVYRWMSRVGSLGLKLLWHLVHFVISIYYFALGIINALESHLISKGVMKRYKDLSIDKIRYLALVLDNQEAQKTSKIIELLQYLVSIGVKHVCLYDREGMLKKSKNIILEKLPSFTLFEDACEDDLLNNQQHTLEFASCSDGKEAVVKAANVLFTKYMNLDSFSGDEEEKLFTEQHMDEALRAVGCKAPEPDLLLVYGPVRCHEGFPAWRIRYTEIVHMGPLDSLRYGSLIKAIHKFTQVRQNYGK